MYGEEPSASADRMGPVARPPWSGGGGSWAVWPVRAVPRAAIFDETPASANPDGGAGNDTGSSASGFPVALGEAFAARSGEVYLNYSPDAAARRAQELAAFIPASVAAKDRQFAWSGSGTSAAQATEVAGVDVSSASSAVVTLLSTVNGKPIELGGHAPDGGLVVSAEPGWLPVPSVAAFPAAQQAGSDATAQGALASRLPGFFQAFASGDQAAIDRYLAPGAPVGGLGGAVSFGGITSLQVPQGGSTRDITVTVNWALPGQASAEAPRLATTYDMSVVDQQSGRWYVKDIRASTQPMGTQ